ncbi:MAG: hypothetical protein OEZ43_14350 [Gammaproteobacteria bacterium]|nr:hypothetical protein [Gammaproteobacteria bacterium]
MYRFNGNLSFVSKAVTRTTRKLAESQRSYVQLFVKVADRNLLESWHREVQRPYINLKRERADRGWNWPGIMTLQGSVADRLGQEPVFYAVGLKRANRFIPLGLVFLAKNYYALYDSTKKGCFIWYVTSAPDEFYNSIGIPRQQIPSIGNILVDIGITVSFNQLKNGVVGLHASPKGKPDLVDFYGRVCKLKRLSSHIPIGFLGLSRRNDGRYFYSDEQTGFKLSCSLDGLR